MNRRLFLASGLLAALPRPAAARLTEIHEEFGHAPHAFALSVGSSPLVNHPGRVYLYREIGNFGHTELRCHYRGGRALAADAVALFAGVTNPARTVRLAVGPGQTTTFEKKLPVAFDWSFQDAVRASIGGRVGHERSAELTIQINVAVPPPADPGLVRRLVADLDNSWYVIRATAERELAKLGRSAKPTLLAEWAGGSPEARARIDGLLARLPGLAVNDFEIPTGLRVIAADRPVDPALHPLHAEVVRFVEQRGG